MQLVSPLYKIEIYNLQILLIFFFFFYPRPALPLFKVCPSVFVVPVGYLRRGGTHHTPVSNNDEELLQ